MAIDPDRHAYGGGGPQHAEEQNIGDLPGPAPVRAAYNLVDGLEEAHRVLNFLTRGLEAWTGREDLMSFYTVLCVPCRRNRK